MSKVFAFFGHLLKIGIASSFSLIIFPIVDLKIGMPSYFFYFFIGAASYFIVDLFAEIWVLVSKANIVLKKLFFR